MAIVFLLWHSIFKFCFHYFILFRFIKFWHISVESVASWQLVAALFDSFLCVFVSMLASQMKWFSVAYSAKSTKSYICNFNFHPFVMVVNSTIFPLSFSPMNEWNKWMDTILPMLVCWTMRFTCWICHFAERKIDKLNRENSVIWIV